MKIKTVLMLGAGGVSMHQLALAYLNMGFAVLCYDRQENEYTRALVNAGAQFSKHFNKDFLNVDFCVRTAAIKEDNRYILALKKLKIKILDRAQALAELAKNFGCVVAVAGTHGKSTTCALIYEMLRQAGKKVSCHIGADVFEPRFCLNDDFLVVEACEFNKSFLSLHPNVAVVTNVEPEHLDCYKTMFNLRLAFKTFLNHAQTRFVFKTASTQFLKAKNTNFVGSSPFNFCPKLKGEYNKNNIILAAAVCAHLGVNPDVIVKVANSFLGIPRRYQFVGTIGKRKVFIDYAHHPTEVQAFVSAFKLEHANAQIIFQPHTYSRTKMLFKEFLSCFKQIKNLIIYKEYPAREKPCAGLSAHDLYLAIKPFNPDVKYCATPKSVIKNILDADLAFVGAGNINQIAQKIVEKFN